MYRNFPEKVTLIEVGTRDGFQFETLSIPTDLKIEIITALADAGLKHIQAVSFVHPGIVPQMADAEEVLKRLPERDDVCYSGLVLNIRGLERAYRAGLKHVEISISASDTHSRKNTGMSLDQAIEQGKTMIHLAQGYGMHIRAGIQCAFGCVYEGSIPKDRIVKMAGAFLDAGIEKLAIADTTGMASPRSVKMLTESLLTSHSSLLTSIPIVLHLHDTRGLGLTNVMTAMDCGITHFDTALAGMGGCPFVTGAAGNIATEDTAYLMSSLNIETGIDIAKVSACSRSLEAFFGKAFPGKIYRLDSKLCC